MSVDKEKFAESLRAKVMAVVVAIAALLAFLGGVFPELNIPQYVDLEQIDALVYGVSLVASVFIAGRSYRNSKVSDK